MKEIQPSKEFNSEIVNYEIVKEEGVIERFLSKKLHNYVEPTRKGTPKGEKIGLSSRKYIDSIQSTLVVQLDASIMDQRGVTDEDIENIKVPNFTVSLEQGTLIFTPKLWTPINSSSGFDALMRETINSMGVQKFISISVIEIPTSMSYHGCP